jgi:hypothetical protein
MRYRLFRAIFGIKGWPAWDDRQYKDQLSLSV